MTNVLRNKWDPEVDPRCYFCKNELDTTWHILYNCEKVKCLWRLLICWLNYILNMEIELNEEIAICNAFEGNQADLLNLIILITKQYIYAVKCTKSELKILTLIQKIYDTKNAERIIAIGQNRMYKFHKKWDGLEL